MKLIFLISPEKQISFLKPGHFFIYSELFFFFEFKSLLLLAAPSPYVFQCRLAITMATLPPSSTSLKSSATSNTVQFQMFWSQDICRLSTPLWPSIFPFVIRSNQLNELYNRNSIFLIFIWYYCHIFLELPEKKIMAKNPLSIAASVQFQ